MAPLITFISLIKGWQAAAIVAAAILLVGGMHLSQFGLRDWPTILPTTLVLLAMNFTLAFMLFALNTDKFGAVALFPSVTLVLATSTTSMVIETNLQDPRFPLGMFLFLGLVVTLMASCLVCAIIALRQKLGRKG